MISGVKQTTYVIGHINPDTDSICSAIAYADLKQKITGDSYHAKRAGQINAETQYVLNRFGVQWPSYLPDVRTQVMDIDVERVPGVTRNVSVKEAWETMGEANIVTLPVVDGNNHLEGLITIGDIAKSYMSVYDNRIISNARTPYSNIVRTLNGELIAGDDHGEVTEGKVLIAAANPDVMENYIEKNDIVILGNRYESQLCAIEMSAQCIIVCDGATISYTISKLAQERGCAIIKTPYDTYTATRLLNQSIPIRFFMKSDNLITFGVNDFVDEIREIMAKKRFRDFPILDWNGNYYGMISRRSLLGARRKRLILVDHNEQSQAVDGLEEADIMEIIDHHRLGNIETLKPVFFRNQPLGCTATIIYQMYQENAIDTPPHIAGLLCAAILSDTLIFRSPTCTEIDKAAAETLARIADIDMEEFAREMFAAGSNLSQKSPEEIFYQDFKKFFAGETTFGVGQINAMSSSQLDEIKDKLLPYIPKAHAQHDVPMLFFMLTDIMNSQTEMLVHGDGAEELLRQSFHLGPGDPLILQEVVSRKKQLIPTLMAALQQDEIS